MIEIYEKRGRWCFKDASDKVHKFATEAEAKAALGWKEPEEEACCECEDCDCDPCECEDDE
jgi:hypothetical protein